MNFVKIKILNNINDCLLLLIKISKNNSIFIFFLNNINYSFLFLFSINIIYFYNCLLYITKIFNKTP